MTEEEHNKQPSLLDVFNLVKTCATKDDIDELTQKIATHTKTTNKKITDLNVRVDHIASSSETNTECIEQLETNIEILKQNQLKNNICISGIPVDIVQSMDTAEIIVTIADVLGMQLNRSNFNAYTVANSKFIIVHMFNIKEKLALVSIVREKKSLLAEEVFGQTQSNNRIFLNDHLTPYFNRLFVLARKAKAEGILASVTSYGGKIKIRKSNNDIPIIIYTEKQLQECIGVDGDISSISLNSDSVMETNNSTPDNSKTQTKNSNTQKSKSITQTHKTLHQTQPKKNEHNRGNRNKGESKNPNGYKKRYPAKNTQPTTAYRTRSQRNYTNATKYDNNRDLSPNNSPTTATDR